MSYECEIKNKIGDQHKELVKFAEGGRMTANDFEQFAEELTKPGEPTRVFGNHIRRIRNQGITWNNKVEMRKILEDWYVEEAYELTPDEAKKKIFDVSKKVGNMKSLFSEKRETVTDSRKDETDNTGKEETGAATVTITHVEGPLIIGGHVGTFVGRDDNSTSNTFNVSSLDSHLQNLLTDGQKQFLEKHLKEESLTTLDGLPGTGMSLLKFDTILRSVCMIETPDGGQGTGFLTKISRQQEPWYRLHDRWSQFQRGDYQKAAKSYRPRAICQLQASLWTYEGNTWRRRCYQVMPTRRLRGLSGIYRTSWRETVLPWQHIGEFTEG